MTMLELSADAAGVTRHFGSVAVAAVCCSCGCSSTVCAQAGSMHM